MSPAATGTIEVLLVEDDEDHAELVRRSLISQTGRCRITHVTRPSIFRTNVASTRFRIESSP